MRRLILMALGSFCSQYGPITYKLDEVQYLVVGAGDTLYGFAMRARQADQIL